MIKSILICDSRGYAFYSRIFDKNLTGYDSTLFSGFISAIGTIGRELFKEEIATISFGYDSNAPNIVVLSKDFFGTDKRIYFVFLTQGDIDLQKVKILRILGKYSESRKLLNILLSKNLKRGDLYIEAYKLAKIEQDLFSQIRWLKQVSTILPNNPLLLLHIANSNVSKQTLFQIKNLQFSLSIK